MTNKKDAIPQVAAALNLDGDPNHLKTYYSNWASRYNKDIEHLYTGPATMVQILLESIATLPDTSVEGDGDSVSFDPTSAQIMDAGCGTGMVGELMLQRGFDTIDGIDLSPQMIEEARKLDVYRSLTGDIDLNQPLHDQRPDQKSGSWDQCYDIVTCCGVFTLGHVVPDSLANLFSITKKGGLVVTSVRTSYYESYPYQLVTDQLVDQGHAVLLRQVLNAPYTDDGDAHYFVYQKC